MTPQQLPFERLTMEQRIAAYFRAHPSVWIDGRELAGIGGYAAWRTRVSECRQAGMDIANRTARRNGYTVSEYRYIPPGQHTEAA